MNRHVMRVSRRQRAEMIRTWAAALITSFVIGLGLGQAKAGGVPNLPSTPQFEDPANTVATLNALINQLNGYGIGFGGYAPSGPVGLGQFCFVNGLTVGTPQTCNATRGTITTATMTTAAQTAQALQINSNLINANSVCVASISNNSGAFGTNGVPIVYATLPGAGNLQIFIGNAGAANALNGVLNIGFYCYQ